MPSAAKGQILTQLAQPLHRASSITSLSHNSSSAFVGHTLIQVPHQSHLDWSMVAIMKSAQLRLAIASVINSFTSTTQ
jgi:hypothetical protein